MMAPTTTATKQQTADLLVLLYNYVVGHVPSHAVLVPAVVALRDAAQSYGRDDAASAFRLGVQVYQFLINTRATNPDLPLP